MNNKPAQPTPLTEGQLRALVEIADPTAFATQMTAYIIKNSIRMISIGLDPDAILSVLVNLTEDVVSQRDKYLLEQYQKSNDVLAKMFESPHHG